jgi:hypothetical protein
VEIAPRERVAGSDAGKMGALEQSELRHRTPHPPLLDDRAAAFCTIRAAPVDLATDVRLRPEANRVSRPTVAARVDEDATVQRGRRLTGRAATGSRSSRGC